MMGPGMNRMPMGPYQDQMGGGPMGGYQGRPSGPGPMAGMGGPNMRMMGPGPGMVRGPGPGQYNMGGGPGGPGSGGRMMSPGPGMGPGGPPGMGGPRMPPVSAMDTSSSGPGQPQSQGLPPGGQPQPPPVTSSGGGDSMMTMTDGGQESGAGGGGGGGPPAGATATPPPNAGGKVTPTPGQKEVNISTVCRIGQETVEEIVSRTQEVFSILKSLHPPVGGYNKMSQMQDQSQIEKQKRLNDVLNGIGLLFKRLRVCWDKCQENTGGMDFYPIESLIPLKDEMLDTGRTELEKKRGDAYKTALEEHNELVQQITIKNRHLKDIIDQMRNIIWEINTMLAMRTN